MWETRPPWDCFTPSQPPKIPAWTTSRTRLWSWCLLNSKIYTGSKRSSMTWKGYRICLRMHSLTHSSYSHIFFVSLSASRKHTLLSFFSSSCQSSISWTQTWKVCLQWCQCSLELNVVFIADFLYSLSPSTSGLLLLICCPAQKKVATWISWSK